MPYIEMMLQTGTVSADATVPGGRHFVDLVRQLLAEAISQGVENAGRMLARLTKQDRFAAPSIDRATAWMSARSALAGKWNRDLEGAVIQVLNNAIATKASLRDTVAALRVVFNNFSGSRLETIARTETTAAFNHGLQAAWHDEDEVIGYQWLAILDHRTCPLCASRDRMIILKKNPALQRMIPPAHVNCRCILVPITLEEYNALKSQEPELFEQAEALFFEPGSGPQTLEEALDWSEVPPPAPGFGGTSGAAYRRRRRPTSRPVAPRPLPLEDVEEIQSRASAVSTREDSLAFLLWLLLLLKRHKSEASSQEEDDEDEDEESEGEAIQ